MRIQSTPLLPWSESQRAAANYLLLKVTIKAPHLISISDMKELKPCVERTRRTELVPPHILLPLFHPRNTPLALLLHQDYKGVKEKGCDEVRHISAF